MRRRCVTAALALILLATGSAGAAQWWNWTEPRPYHHSVVMVDAGRSGGTGVLVSPDGLVVTAAHVVQGHTRATARWINGHRASGPILSYSSRWDLAAFRVSSVPEGAVVARVAGAAPSPGDVLDHCGFGGPASGERNPRRFTAAMIGADAATIRSRANVISGDSGGPVFNAAGELVGIISGGQHNRDVGLRDRHGHPWRLVYPCRMAHTRLVRGLLFSQRRIGSRMLPALCPGGT